MSSQTRHSTRQREGEKSTENCYQVGYFAACHIFSVMSNVVYSTGSSEEIIKVLSSVEKNRLLVMMTYAIGNKATAHVSH